MIRDRVLPSFIIIFILNAYQIPAQENQLSIRHLSNEDGLSQSTVNCILQDYQGFLWIGTQDGLNKFDGYTFEIFKHQPLDSNSISHNWIWDVFEDKNKILWIATWEGLTSYDPSATKFVRYLPDISNSKSINNSRPTSITQDKKSNLWIGTWGGGLNVYNSENERFHAFQTNPSDSQTISSNYIRTLYLDSQNFLWIGTWNGLCRINPDSLRGEGTLQFKHFPITIKNSHTFSGIKITSIHENQDGIIRIGTLNSGVFQYSYDTNRLVGLSPYPDYVKNSQINVIFTDSYNNFWIGSQDMGLSRFNMDNRTWSHYTSDTSQLSSNRITSIFEDRSGILWIGTFNNGLNVLNVNEKRFSYYKHSRLNKNSISGDLVRSFYKDKLGYIWIGTENNGLNKLDPNTGIFTHFRHNPAKPYSISHDNIQSIAADNSDNLWIGTYGGGLNYYDRNKNKFYHLKHNPRNINSLSSNTIETLCLIEDTLLWIGTANSGLDKYNVNSKKFTHYTFDPNDTNSISSNYTLSLYQDSRKRLWIGGWGGGLNLYDANTNQFKRFIHNPENKHSLCDNIVNVIFETDDKDNSILWVGTAGGLSYMSLMDSSFGTFNHFFEQDGLPNQHIYGIVQDNQKNLWISTNNGLSKFTPPSSFRNYSSNDGLPRNEFSGGAYYRSEDGQLFFGSSNGFITFYPDSIKKNPNIPAVVITNFQKFNKTVKIGKSISTVQKLNLSYKDKVFSFEFAALDFAAPLKNQYAYIMEGFHKDWIYTDAGKRSATFTNLNPGNYLFRVKGSNNDGIWNEEGTSVRIIIAPPFWQTWWFRSQILALILFLAFIAHYFRVRQLKKSQEAQQKFSAKLIESQEQERKRIASELHDSLGQNLLIINNEIQQCILQPEKSNDELQHISATVKESISEVREISYNLHPHQLEQLGLTKAIVSSINNVSHASNIQFDLSIENSDDVLYKKDEIHFFRIIQETVNNILKHSQASNAVIHIKKEHRHVRAFIADNGRGFAVKTGTYKNPESLGLGVSGMTERAKLIGGTLHIHSEPGKGTQIEVKVPVPGSRKKDTSNDHKYDKDM